MFLIAVNIRTAVIWPYRFLIILVRWQVGVIHYVNVGVLYSVYQLNLIINIGYQKEGHVRRKVVKETLKFCS